MKPFRSGPITGVIWKPLQKYGDERGWLCEMFRNDELPSELRPQMAYLSETLPGVCRGPHEHREQRAEPASPLALEPPNRLSASPTD